MNPGKESSNVLHQRSQHPIGISSCFPGFLIRRSLFVTFRCPLALLLALLHPSGANPGDGHEKGAADIPERVHPFRIQPRLPLFGCRKSRVHSGKLQRKEKSQRFRTLSGLIAHEPCRFLVSQLHHRHSARVRITSQQLCQRFRRQQRRAASPPPSPRSNRERRSLE